jgi:hypothetical protein
MKRTGLILAQDDQTGFKPLGAFGKPVHLSHLQIRSVLRSQGSPALAHYLAVPIPEGQSSKLSWMAEVEGPVRRLEELPSPQQGRALVESLTQELEGLVQRLRHSGSHPGTAAAMASVLDQARKVPAPGEFLRFVGDQPVLVWWGFERPGESPTTDPLPNKTTGLPALPPREKTTSQSPPSAKPQIPPSEPVPVRKWQPWWLWLLILLLLLAALALLLSQCSSSMQTAPAPAASLSIPEGSPEKGDLSFLKGNWQFGEGRLTIYVKDPKNVVGSEVNTMVFDDKGRGKSFAIERRAHGPEEQGGQPLPDCEGDARAFWESSKLVIEQSQRCREGTKAFSSRHECERNQDGSTSCVTVNSDGVRWGAVLKRIPGNAAR